MTRKWFGNFHATERRLRLRHFIMTSQVFIFIYECKYQMYVYCPDVVFKRKWAEKYKAKSTLLIDRLFRSTDFNFVCVPEDYINDCICMWEIQNRYASLSYAIELAMLEFKQPWPPLDAVVEYNKFKSAIILLRWRINPFISAFPLVV